jgi:hypothetical protein
MWGDPLTLRAVERIIAVAIGGVAIWCGYRLFLAIPDQRADGRAELTLSKDRRLLISRIGPGTFFGLFGTAVVVASFLAPVTASFADGSTISGFGPRAGVAAMGGRGTHTAVAPLGGHEARHILAFLNDLEAEGAERATGMDRDRRMRRFRETKLAVMERAWQGEWGDPVEFRLWLAQAPAWAPSPSFERALAVLGARE